ncbi:MAG: serine/threonine protein kinase [Ktedonobacteraceae bacterium]|nr:serine/threonine protein kinase [Ktedonobacteraceae bacterium]
MSDIESLVGKRLGNYTLTKLLGKGGFAAVYLAVHRHLETQAAIKVLHTRLSENEQQNFLAEARIVARMKHPHIIHILEFGLEDNEIPYLVMNYTPNGTLRNTYLRGRPVPLRECLPILRQVASALQYAHDQKFIHRDIKPENMLIGEHNEVFLSDFGIATQARSSRSQTIQEVTGTVSYMAPEQLQGKPRIASDQYSLGIVVYELLTGDRPFRGANYIEIAAKHVQTPPPSLRQKVPAITPAIDQVVLTTLAKDPHQRYVCVSDFVEALEIALRTGQYRAPNQFPSCTTQNQPDRPDHLDPTIAAVAPAIRPYPPASTVKVQGDTVLAPADSSMTPDYVHTMAASQSMVSMTTSGAISSSPATHLSRRRFIIGGCAAAVVLCGGLVWWRAMQGASGDDRTQTNGDASHQSPYLAAGKVLRVYKAHTGKLAAVAWSPDGKHLISGGEDSTLRLWEMATGDTLSSMNVYNNIKSVAWSPDSRYIAMGSFGDGNSAIIWNATNILQLRIYKESGDSLFSGKYVTWSPDSRFLAIASRDPYVWDMQNPGTPAGYKNPDYRTLGEANALAWSSNSKRIVTAETNGYVRIWSLDGDKQHADYTLQGSGEQLSVDWSKKTQRIVIGAEQQVALWDVNTNSKAFSQTYDRFAAPVAWSPDGEYVASVSSNVASYTIQIWHASTGQVVSTCEGHSDLVSALAWSPDGKVLASASSDKTVRLWQVTVAA